MDNQDNNQDQNNMAQGNNHDTEMPAHLQSTVPSQYDYSHLREPESKGHWYAPPQNSDPSMPQQTPPVVNPLPQQPSIAYPPPNQPAAVSYPMQNNPDPAIPSPVTYPPPPQGSTGGAYTLPPGSARQRIHQRHRRKASGMPENWAWVVIAAALLGVTVIGSLLLILVIRYAVDDNSNQALADVPPIEPTSIIYSDGEGGALEGNSLEIQTKKWDGKERFTILLMGLDKRPDESGTAFRTDSMILVSLDPINNSIGMLSIPRDLYVEVPYSGLQRVNAAYVIGELDEPNGGGARLAKQTVQYNFGIAVNEYITFDFQTVISVVDAIGGVDIEVPKPITDYEYPTMDYGTEVFHVDAGWQLMDGTTALKYARTRHASDDIDRASRQQQVIYAVRDKVTSLEMLDDLIVQAPFLYGELKAGIDTGLSLDQIIQLTLWAAEVPRENIHSGVVSWEYLSGYQTPSGGSVLVPNRSLIGDLMVEVFGANYNQTP